VLSAMARSTIKFLKQQGQFNTRIASLVGSDRHTVARVLTGSPRTRASRNGGASCTTPRSPALVDRLLHHGEVYYLKGDSYRLRGKPKTESPEPVETAVQGG